MNVTALLPNRPGASAASTAPAPEVVMVRPVRAAFGPHVSLVSVDAQGRLWMRFSTAMGMLIAGVVLMTIPMMAMWWVSAGLVDSGRVSLREDAGIANTVVPNEGQQQPVLTTPTELPLAGTSE